MRTRKPAVWMSLASLLLAAGMAVAQSVTAPSILVQYPELIVHNAKIVPMSDKGFNQNTGTPVQAMAVRNGKVLAMGTSSEMLALAGPQTRKIDVKGRTIIPGIINTHSHMHDHSIQLWSRNNAKKIEEVRRTFTVTGKIGRAHV